MKLEDMSIEELRDLSKRQEEEIHAARKQAEAMEADRNQWATAWHDLRADVLSGVDGLDNDQVNTVLGMLDNYEPEAAPQQHAQAALSKVHAFLLGEGSLDGFHFGDSDTARPRPAYWWRNNLRTAIAAAPKLSPDGPALRDQWAAVDAEIGGKAMHVAAFDDGVNCATLYAPAIQQEGAALDERYAACIATIRDLDRISMNLSAALVQLPVVEGSIKRNIDYFTRQDVFDLVVEWRTEWDKNSAQRHPINRAALTKGQK